MLCLLHSKSLMFMRLPATRGSISQGKFFSGTNMESIIMPYFSKILNSEQRENAIGSACFQSIRTSWSSRRACRLKHTVSSESLSVAGPLPCFRTQIIPPGQTYRPCTHRMEASDRSTQPLPPGKNMVDGRQHPGFPP